MTDSDPTTYDVAVVGGGPAGLTAALYTTRLGLDTVVVNRGGGRAAMMQETHNVIGITEDVSGAEFLQTAQEQVQAYGADYRRGFVSDIDEADDGFRLTVDDGHALSARRVVLATGFSDERPDPPLPPTGRGLHYCLHCDAYMFVDEPVYVMGHGDSAAYVAMIMLNFTDEVDLLLRGDDPSWSDETDRMLRAHPIDVIDAEITGMNRGPDGWLESFEFEDGTTREYRGGFPMYGSDYNNDLAAGLGCDRNDDGTVVVDDHGRTSVDGVYAVGDLVPGHNQIPVAMGQGAKAGIAIHMDLRAFPRSVEEIEEQGPVDPAEVPAMSESLRETARAFREQAAESAADD
ncbi:NAD(P)/FAD-dependent oxidoreductase [Haloplanus aerogenes]|uniref:NAD(P)/FAD-dependent oxidoreductase n=1 Tax=Haloplanus aerogenes TaxID=660522 RepID=A0A3M0E2L6_9EURY|nr:NAD(P)/FAD-dependent oxidoreductase [Haloplanus aerogenes]AZH25917.1 NAD(P)/FAD-dependent oxidoreductase [Haloplanus aerogenes]RMB25673.1 thioredoxin reductase (NADPH) [Haloplanus aerogenes]